MTTPNDQSETPLLPCPFCGAEAVVNEHIKRVAINCKNPKCWAQQKGPREDFHLLVIAWNSRQDTDLRTQLAAAQRERDCLTCSDLTNAGKQSLVRAGVYRCLECENYYCREHAVMHFTAGTRKRPLQCETLEISNAALEMTIAERDQLCAEVARLTEKLRGKNIVITEKNAELVSIASQVAELQRDREQALVHLGNCLDEVWTTSRGEWPRDLFCIECKCCVSKQEPHKPDCHFGQAIAFWDAMRAKGEQP